MDLTQEQLLRVVAVFELAKISLLDAARGRSLRAEDIANIRKALTRIHPILRQLDEAGPWNIESRARVNVILEDLT